MAIYELFIGVLTFYYFRAFIIIELILNTFIYSKDTSFSPVTYAAVISPVCYSTFQVFCWFLKNTSSKFMDTAFTKFTALLL